MQNALYVGLSKQVALHREIDIIANNLANLDTTGFKGEGARFEQYLTSSARMDGFPAGGDRRVAYVRDAGLVRDMSEGGLKQTGRDLDIAIRGQGFFAVDTPNGERYTRNGGFQLNKNGELVTSQGYRVRGANGPIQFDQADSDISIAADGTISTRNNNQDTIRGKLRVVRFDNPETLQKEGGSLYSAGGITPQNTDDKTSVVQGSLEQSNVKPILEMSRMMEVMRSYSSIANMITNTDNLRKTALDKLSDVSS